MDQPELEIPIATIPATMHGLVDPNTIVKLSPSSQTTLAIVWDDSKMTASEMAAPLINPSHRQFLEKEYHCCFGDSNPKIPVATNSEAIHELIVGPENSLFGITASGYSPGVETNEWTWDDLKVDDQKYRKKIDGRLLSDLNPRPHQVAPLEPSIKPIQLIPASLLKGDEKYYKEQCGILLYELLSTCDDSTLPWPKPDSKVFQAYITQYITSMEYNEAKQEWHFLFTIDDESETTTINATLASDGHVNHRIITKSTRLMGKDDPVVIHAVSSLHSRIVIEDSDKPNYSSWLAAVLLIHHAPFDRIKEIQSCYSTTPKIDSNHPNSIRTPLNKSWFARIDPCVAKSGTRLNYDPKPKQDSKQKQESLDKAQNNLTIKQGSGPPDSFTVGQKRNRDLSKQIQESKQETKHSVLVPAFILSQNRKLYQLQCGNLMVELLNESKDQFPHTVDVHEFRKDVESKLSRLEYDRKSSIWQFTFAVKPNPLIICIHGTHVTVTRNPMLEQYSDFKYSSDGAKTWNDYIIDHESIHPSWAIVAWLLSNIKGEWANQIRTCYSM